METVYNCRRYQYETGEHITFYHHTINAGKEKPEDSLLNKTHDISDRTPEAEKHAMAVSASRAKNNVYRIADVDNLTFKAWKIDRKKNQIIYNITDWSYGFTTATKVLDTGRVSSYITKYITKSVDEHLKEKRRYYYSRNCHIAEEEHFLLDEEDFSKIYDDRIVYVKTVDIPQASQQITYYELKY